MVLCLFLASCGGGSGSSNPVTVTGIIIEAPSLALRGSEILITPRAQTSSTSAVSTTLIPPAITVTVDQGTLLDSQGQPVAALTVDSGTEVLWRLPDSVGTFAARATYSTFSTSAVVLTTDAPGGQP